MGRLNIYVKQKIENEVRDIVRAEIQKGAAANEMSISSMCNELLRLGLMVYKAQDEEGSAFDVLEFRRDLIKKAAASREAGVLITAMMSEVYERVCGNTDRGQIDEIINKNLTAIYNAESAAEQTHFVENQEE
ncbi:relaxosome protein TraM [Serratia ficaria]|uniref:relaxosome protein TraM n=1 Tax=Serratia ficaria TaxID=61651 RepID=UPI0021CA9C23|nr:relaxosome protein TraM [Serratia ficaria]